MSITNLALNIDKPDFQYTVGQILLPSCVASRETTMPENQDSQRTPSLISEGHILQMILDDIKNVKGTLDSHTADERHEFRRIVDKMGAVEVSLRLKIEEVEDSLRDKIEEHAEDITALKTKMQLVAWISGGVAGLASSLAVAFARTLMG